MQASTSVLQLPIQSAHQLESLLKIIKETQQNEHQKCIKFINQTLIPKFVAQLRQRLDNNQQLTLVQIIDLYLKQNNKNVNQINLNDLAKLFHNDQNENLDTQQLITQWKEILEEECEDCRQGKRSQKYYDKYYNAINSLALECNKEHPYFSFKMPNPVPLKLKIRKIDPQGTFKKEE